MKRINPITAALAAVLALACSTVSCSPTAPATALPTPCPTPDLFAAPPYPQPVPTKTAVPTRAAASPPDYSRPFLEALPAAPQSCRPDGTAEDIGVYIYDLTDDRELVSINADVPFQFASAFKGPALVYFLSSCRKYWDPSSAAWDEYFHDLEAARGMDYYTSPEYRQALAEFLSDPAGWKDADGFFADHRAIVNGMGGPIDTRYFILPKVHHMIAQSGNLSAADVLLFVFENCLQAEGAQVEIECGGPNALTAFNAWFDEFAGLSYESGTPRRGLHRWDTVIEMGPYGRRETTLTTFGLVDSCASQPAILKCNPSSRATNTYTPRDLFKFYSRLHRLENETLREAAFRLLKSDENGPARGYLKNLARNMRAIALGKNGSAYYSTGPIIAEAGIVRYKGKAFAVVTLSFNALESMTILYGSYDSDGEALGDPGLIQNLLEQYTTSP